MARITFGDISLTVTERGARVPLLLIHGFPLDHTMWSAQIDALARQNRVIAPDLRGFGGSDVTPGTVTMAQYADDLAQLLDAMQVREPVVFCGLSMGGYVAWQFWARHR
ncbi:MAG: alpha/beta fold hydrolase, partial [Pirellulaceae bacterium]